MISEGRIVKIIPFENSDLMKWLEIKVDERTIEQITLADVSEGDVISVDTDSTAIFDRNGVDITYMPQPVTIHGTVTRSLDSERLIVSVDPDSIEKGTRRQGW